MRPDKPYKAVSPIITINKIRNILNEFGIFLIDKPRTAASNFFSSRINVGDKFYKLDIGTNGKGLTPEYSLASAYGEFMERLQNYFIFTDGLTYAKKEYILENENEFSKVILDNNLVLDFNFDPEEKRISYDELTQIQKEIFDNIATFNELTALALKDNDNKKMLFAPFYCVKEKCTEFLPIGSIILQAKSNGMCAGNTKEEAIIQGMCEIFERYVLKMIYKNEIAPPTIPTTLFEGTKIYDLFSQLEEDNNISIFIKDCSLNKGLPVIGLLIIDHDSNSFAFHIGADPSPVIALERCFTELLQGRELNEAFIQFDITKDPFVDSTLPRAKRVNKEFMKFVVDGSGSLPNSILSSNFSYPFTVLNQDLNKSDKEDLKYLLGKVEELGFRTYIRDVSFLNFPTFFVYIPGMSETENVFKDNEKYKSIKKDYSLLYNLKNHSTEEFIHTAEILEDLSSQMFKLSPYNIHDDNQIDRHFLLALIYYRISDYSKSYENLNIMIDSFDDDEKRENIHLLCSRDYIYYKAKDLSNEEIVACLKDIYRTELLMDVAHDLVDEMNVFQHLNLPTCFNCEDCELKSGCLYLDILKIVKSLQERHKKNRIDQDSLKWVSQLS